MGHENVTNEKESLGMIKDVAKTRAEETASFWLVKSAFVCFLY